MSLHAQALPPFDNASLGGRRGAKGIAKPHLTTSSPPAETSPGLQCILKRLLAGGLSLQQLTSLRCFHGPAHHLLLLPAKGTGGYPNWKK